MHKLTFDIAHLRKYVNGELSSKEMHEVERAAHDDEMLSDILMGLEIEKSEGNPAVSFIDIHHKIVNRTQRKSASSSLLHNRPLQIAASILIILSGLLFWYNQDQHPKTEQTLIADAQQEIIGPSHDRIAEISSTPDSTVKLFSNPDYSPPRETNENIQRHQNLSGNPHSRKLTEQESQILAYTPTEKNIDFNQDFAGTLNLSHPKHENDVIIINTEGQDKYNLMASNQKKQTQPKIADTRVSSNPNTPLSSAQMRARLSSLGLDSQTDLIWGQVLDQRSKQPLAGVEVTDTQNDNVVLTDADGRFLYAANNKKSLKIIASGYRAKEVKAEDGSQTILLSPLEDLLDDIGYESKVLKSGKSIPTIGWEKYMTYLFAEIDKTTEKEYDLSVRMELNKDGRPTNVSIIRSSDKELNAKVIYLIENGSAWETGVDSKNIYLQIKPRK